MSLKSKNSFNAIQLVTIVLCVLLTNYVVQCQQQITVPNTPCPNIFSYDYDNNQQQVIGRMTIPSPQLGERLQINLEMSLPASLPSVCVCVFPKLLILNNNIMISSFKY